MMQSSSQAPKPRRFDASRRTANSAGSKLRGPSFQKEDKNMNTITTPSPRRTTKAPAASSRSRTGTQLRAPVIQSRMSSQKQGPAVSRSAKPKPKNTRPSVMTQIAPEVVAPPLPLPSVLPSDPNCNEPSLPCSCCDGRSPQDNNSMFNHNHNNNNTISIRQQSQLPPPPPVVPLAHQRDGMEAKEPVSSRAEEPLAQPAANSGNDAKIADENADVDNKKAADEEDEEEESSRDIITDDDEDEETDSEDDDTSVPSCCDCPPSLLEFSLSSSTSSSSTSISSCSDSESDCADQCASMCSLPDQEQSSAALNPKDQFPEFKPPSSLPSNQNPFSLTSRSPASCSPDEGYPSALDSPSPDYLGVKGDSDTNKSDLLDFLESVGEFGKMERFSQVIQVARWDSEGEQHWDVSRDRLDHSDRLEKVNREVKLAYIARLHEKGFDLGDSEEQDLSDIMDEMGNIDIPLKLYKTRDGTMGESQEFSDAGVDLTAPSDCEDPLAPDSLTPSPIEPPPRPPKPPARHASVSSDLHTYINISRETTSMAVTTSPTLTTFPPNSSSPTFSTFRCEKPLPPSPPSIPPLPATKPVPYLTLYTTPSPPPSIPTPTPPIPPPRKRHLARKEAQRLAALQAEQEKTPLSLPPPTTRPPPLPPPPVISVTCSNSPPAIPPPPASPPPPSFHTLDVEIRKSLMLAGLTQAELLKLSPELGVCVGESDDEEEADNRFTSGSSETREFRLQDREAEKKNDTGKVDGDGKASDEGNNEAESKDRQRTTSFTEIARRRRKNNTVVTDHYYSTSFNNPHEATVKNFSYLNELPDSPPPPPPPRPLPPIPPSVAPLKVSTLPANSEQPERFDWLIAFTPECEAPPQFPVPEKKKSTAEIPKKLGSSGSSPGSGPKVTTFKELRFRSKSTSPPTKVIIDPEPDPTVVTPDPDILYNSRWRREKAGSDGSQWEYTSQAQASFMQPPPALTSMAALNEMSQRADKEGGQSELCPSQKIGSLVSDRSSWNVGHDREMGEVKQEMKERKMEEVKEEVEARGRADGGRTFESRTSAVRSVSFTGSVEKIEVPWMGDDVEHPVRGLGSTSSCSQEKKASVSGVSAAVEAILAQFSSSRTVVQKALSGDSTINPSSGRSVSQCSCPASHNLSTDSLKPHQSDSIAGRRPNSAWSSVQATTRTAPKTQALFNLQARICESPQSRHSKQRFNAFLLGLLNIKLLDFWSSHLQSCSDVSEAYYHPSSFMRLSSTKCRPLFEESLLVSQPSSSLTFNLDSLFQHHHLEAYAHRPDMPRSPHQEAGFKSSPQGQPETTAGRYTESLSEVDFRSPERSANTNSSPILNNGGSESATNTNSEPVKASLSFGQTSPQSSWVQEKEIESLPPPNIEEDSFTHQAGQVIQQGWGAVVRWGGRSSQNSTDFSSSASKKDEIKTNSPELQDQAESDYSPVNDSQVPWSLGRLFGASRSPNSPTGHTQPTRRPSEWLAPGVTASTRMVSSTSTTTIRGTPEIQDGGETESEKKGNTTEMKEKPRQFRSVRTSCDHTGTGSELTFCKGEESVVSGGVDQDWIRCRQGDVEGSVPIGYTSLIM